jgi:hypothetical protein
MYEVDRAQPSLDAKRDCAMLLSSQVFELSVRERCESRLGETVSEFERRNGIKIECRGDTYKYVLRAGGAEQTLFQTAASEQGLKDAKKLLDRLVQDKTSEIEQRYRVSIARQDEYIGKMKVMAAQSSGVMDVFARAPKLAELAGLEAALAKSEPSRNDLRVYFVRDMYPRGFGVFAYYDTDPAGRPAIFLQPGVEDRPPTERDRPALAVLSGNLDPGTSLEALVTHEIAHRHQLRMGWDKDTVVTEVAAKMGWKPYFGRRGDTRYLLISNEADSSGNPRLYSNAGSWILSNESGQAIDTSGNLVEPLKAVTLSDDEMMARAAVKPATPYFRDPIEMYAEALMLLRLGDDSRKALLNRSPGLYVLVKTKDQDEIDGEHGPGRFIRSISGELIPDTQANRSSVTSWEAARQ